MFVVCAWCNLDALRIPCDEIHDEEGRMIQKWTECPHCGRTEMRFGKLGRDDTMSKHSWRKKKRPDDDLIRQC